MLILSTRASWRAGVVMFLLLVVVLVSWVAMSSMSSTQRLVISKPTHLVLIGASIGQGWQLSTWHRRVRASGMTAESVAVWQFDKSDAVDEVLMRPRVHFRFGRSYIKSLIRPPKTADIVILKECSAYFPGDLKQYEAHVKEWVQKLRASNKRAMVATVVPVTKLRAIRDPGKQESLLEYNRWLRQYAHGAGVPLLDLEAALASGGEGSYLRGEFALPDGSHLNSRAYAVLDQVLLTSVHPDPVEVTLR